MTKIPLVMGTWTTAIGEYLGFLQATGYAPTTVATRRRHLQWLASVLPDPWQVTAPDLVKCLQDKRSELRRDQGGPLRPSSLGMLHTTLRAFYRWGVAGGRIAVDPCQGLPPAVATKPRKPSTAPDRGWSKVGGEDLTASGRRRRRHGGGGRARVWILPPVWVEALDAYLEAQRAGNAKPGTLRLRRHYLRHLAQVVPDPWTARLDDLCRFLTSDQAWSPETRKSARSTVRSFYGWALDAERIERDPSRRIPSVPVPEAHVLPAPADVVEHAGRAAGARERLMLDLAHLQGMRRSEIACLHTRDVVGDDLWVHGKGGKVRVIPLHPDVAAQLAKVPPGWVFPNLRTGHLTPGYVGKLLGELLGEDWTAHTLRHAAATRWYGQDNDLVTTQRLLGHARPDTTLRYVKVPDAAMRATVLGVTR